MLFFIAHWAVSKKQVPGLPQRFCLLVLVGMKLDLSQVHFPLILLCRVNACQVAQLTPFFYLGEFH